MHHSMNLPPPKADEYLVATGMPTLECPGDDTDTMEYVKEDE